MERTTGTGLLLLKLTQSHPHLILIFPQPQPLSPCHWTHLIKCPNLSSSHSNPRSTSISRPATRWDSDAEPSAGNNKYPRERRRWWSDEDPPDSDAAVEDGGFTLGEIIDSLWVVKVFKPFGWFLVYILPSCYLFTDPRAFILMVSAVTLVQSLVVASQKLLGMVEDRPKRPSKTMKKKPFSSRTATNKEAKNQTPPPSYETRAAANEDSVKRGEKDVSGNFGGWDSDFGGWGDLDEPGYVQRSQSRASPLRGKAMKKAKVRRKRRSSTPLLLRLLISVFPFLSSWTKML